MKKYITPNLLVALLVGLLLGFLLLIIIRFALAQPPEHVHYHANFALYVNGQRDEFDGPGYYEEISACSDEHKNNPKSRTHMHDDVSHVVHVHDNAVTWGDFLANLGYTLGDEVLVTNKGVYVDGKGGTLNFILNGEPVKYISNRLIESEDVLLISYGKSKPAQLDTQYDTIETDASAYNETQDPATCSGNEELTFTQRLQQAIGITDSSSEN